MSEEVAAQLEFLILDIGAMVEGVPRFQGLADQYNAHVTGFEPNPAEFSKLRASERQTYLPHFLGDCSSSTFHMTRYPGCASLYEPNTDLINFFQTIGASAGGNFEVTSEEQVSTRRLDDVYPFDAAHYIKVDVQGAELDVLAAGERVLATTLLVELEVSFVELYRRQPLFGDVQ